MGVVPSGVNHLALMVRRKPIFEFSKGADDVGQARAHSVYYRPGDDPGIRLDLDRSRNTRHSTNEIPDRPSGNQFWTDFLNHTRIGGHRVARRGEVVPSFLRPLSLTQLKLTGPNEATAAARALVPAKNRSDLRSYRSSSSGGRGTCLSLRKCFALNFAAIEMNGGGTCVKTLR